MNCHCPPSQSGFTRNNNNKNPNRSFVPSSRKQGTRPETHLATPFWLHIVIRCIRPDLVSCQRVSMSAPALIPPFRFSNVQQGLYRGSYPTLKNFRFLKRLDLKTVISVIPEPPTSDLAEFCAAEKIVNYHFYAEKFTSDNVTVSPATVSQILQIVIKQENLPVYIHCLDGANVTGIIIMVLRKLQNWTKVSTVSEFCRLVCVSIYMVHHIVCANETLIVCMRMRCVDLRATMGLRKTNRSTWQLSPRRLWSRRTSQSGSGMACGSRNTRR